MPQPVKTNLSEGFDQFLVANGFLKPEQLESLAEVQKQTGQPFSELLISRKLLDEETLVKAKAAFFNVPYVDLRQLQIEPKVLDLIPAESMNFYNVAPFELDGSTLRVAVVDPSNLPALEALEFLGQKQNLQVQVYLGSQTSVDVAIGRKKNLKRVVGQALKDIATKEEAEAKPQVQLKVGSPQVIEEAPIIKIVSVILSNAVEANASDIHIEPSEKDVRVRYRIDGILHTSLMLPKNVHAAVITRIKILSNLKIDESRLPQDGRFHVDVGEKSVDLRVSILPLIYGEKVVMRILDKTGQAPTLEQLGLRGKAVRWVGDEIKKTHGIFLITGPTGSGKSTTLYGILNILNTANVNIVTLEDPVEYFVDGVNQSQINPDIGLTFASGLRSILRQDPNIIMVGEIRDKETAELAVHAALTGHLVFSTLHTNDAVGAVPRLVDMGIEPFLLAATVDVVLAQRLVRKVCPDCRQETALGPALVSEVQRVLQGVPAEYLEGLDLKNPKEFRGKGCDRCGRTGYVGRLGIFEVMPIVPEIQELVLSKTPSSNVYDAAKRLGMITMKQDGVLKALRGETTMEEIIRVTTE